MMFLATQHGERVVGVDVMPKWSSSTGATAVVQYGNATSPDFLSRIDRRSWQIEDPAGDAHAAREPDCRITCARLGFEAVSAPPWFSDEEQAFASVGVDVFQHFMLRLTRFRWDHAQVSAFGSPEAREILSE